MENVLVWCGNTYTATHIAEGAYTFILATTTLTFTEYQTCNS